jgi:hypothetical protein
MSKEFVNTMFSFLSVDLLFMILCCYVVYWSTMAALMLIMLFVEM